MGTAFCVRYCPGAISEYILDHLSRFPGVWLISVLLDLTLVGFRWAYDYFLKMRLRKKENDLVMRNRRKALSRSLSKLLLPNPEIESQVAAFDFKRAVMSLDRSVVSGMHRGSFMSMLDSQTSDRYEELRSKKEVSP